MSAPVDLGAAIAAGDLPLVSSLLASGVHVNRPLTSGQTPLSLAVSCGHEDIVTALIEAGASVNQSDSFRFDEARRCAVHHAAAAGSRRLLTALLDAGADAEHSDGGGATPLHHAAAHGHYAVVDLLLSLSVAVDRRGACGRTALWKAAVGAGGSSRRRLVERLLRAGASVNLQNRVGQTVVFDTIRSAPLTITKDLLSAGLDLSLTDIEGNSALHAAAMLGKTRAVQLFVDHGAKVTVLNEYHNAPLHNSAMHGHPATTVHLLNLGARVNHVNGNGQSALYLSMVHKHRDITRLLHLAGARLSKRELNMYKDFEAWKYEEKQQFFLWAWSLFNTPMTLSCIARIAIRGSFKDGVAPVKGISALPLPVIMKKFLLMADVVTDPFIVLSVTSSSSSQSPEHIQDDPESDDGFDVICDGCETLLNVDVGSSWYTCTACADFDLCGQCWKEPVHEEHRSQMHRYKFRGGRWDTSLDCCSCGAPASLEPEGIMFCCTVCRHFVMCMRCSEEGMHQNHRRDLRVREIQ